MALLILTFIQLLLSEKKARFPVHKARFTKGNGARTDCCVTKIRFTFTGNMNRALLSLS